MHKPRVVISQPFRQHSHQACLAFQGSGMLRRYYTIFWYNRSVFKILENIIPCSLLRELEKRNYPGIDVRFVMMNYLFFFLEAAYKVFRIRNSVYGMNISFDHWVSGKLAAEEFEIFIGYETSALESFRACGELGRVRVLDFASVHYKEQEKVWGMMDYDFYRNDKLKDKLYKIKSEELTLADHIIIPSGYAGKTLLDNGVPESKLIQIPYGADLNVFRPKENYNTGRFRVLYVGLISVRRGLGYLLEAYNRLGLKDSDLVLVGPMGDGACLLREYKGLYNYEPFVSQEELSKFYLESDIFVFPSLFDGFGMAVIEAMASGLPVIVSENTGAKDAVEEGVDGFVVPIMDADKLADKIGFFYANRGKVEEMGRRASQKAQEYSWEIYRDRLKDAILSISQ